jgi:hypothetical protein
VIRYVGLEHSHDRFWRCAHRLRPPARADFVVARDLVCLFSVVGEVVLVSIIRRSGALRPQLLEAAVGALLLRAARGNHVAHGECGVAV